MYDRAVVLCRFLSHAYVTVIRADEAARRQRVAEGLPEFPTRGCPAGGDEYARGPVSLVVDSHSWTTGPRAGSHVCIACRRFAASERGWQALQRERCVPFLPDQRRPWGSRVHGSHRLRLAAAGTAWCFRCGAHADRVPRGLARPCGLPTKAGRAALSRLALGLHPLKPFFVGASFGCDRHGF